MDSRSSRGKLPALRQLLVLPVLLQLAGRFVHRHASNAVQAAPPRTFASGGAGRGSGGPCRREVLLAGAGGAGGLAGAGAEAAVAAAPVQVATRVPVLPLTVGLGTCLVRYLGEVPDKFWPKLKERGVVDVRQQVDWALRAGYRLIDTAQRYKNEEGVGLALRKAIEEGVVQRSDVLLTTKVWVDQMGHDKTISSCEESASKLGVDTIDLLLIHWPGDFGRTRDLELCKGRRKETWRAMEELVQAGKVRSIGVANFGQRHLQELLQYADVPPAVNQFEIHPFNARFGLVDLCHANGIAVMGYSPLGGRNAGGRGTGFTDELFQHPTIVAAAKAHSRTPAQVLLRWALQRGVTPIPKASSEARIRDNFGALQFELAEEEVQAINKMDRREFVVFDDERMP